MPVLIANDLKKSYGHVPAVKGISFSVEKGELFGLIGPDGAGKTTTMRMLVTLLKPDSGMIQVLDRSAETQKTLIRATVGYMPQRFSLYPDLTVEQNIHFFADLFAVPRDVRTERMKRLYQFSHLEEFKDRPARALSGGMKQKLALCCVLIHEPEVLILDEPTVGVDPVSRNEFWNILRELQAQGTTIVVSTAYMDEASLCGKVGLMFEGELLTVDSPGTLIKNFPYPIYHIATPTPYQTFEQLQRTELKTCAQLFGSGIHICDKGHIGPEGLRQKLISYSIAVDSVTAAPVQLEDVFLELLGTRTSASTGVRT